MGIPRRLTVALSVGAVAIGLACGESSAPVIPQTVVLVAGDGQAAPTGTTLPVPLRVTVTGSDTRPFRGATVAWAVISGFGSLSATSSTTDSVGSASTRLTLGSAVGSVSVQATVTGLTPVTFTATAFACPRVIPYMLGSEVSDSLTTTDCRVTAGVEFFYTDFYGLEVVGQQGLTLSMTATQPTPFDTWLELYRRSGDFVAFNDDIDPGVITDSRLQVIIAGGSYVVAPSSYDPGVTGTYKWSAVTRAQTLAGCELVWVTRGITVTDGVTMNDCVVSTTPDSSFGDAVAIVAAGGSVLTIAQRAKPAFNALLRLFGVDQNGNLVEIAANDDSANAGTTTDAYLVHTVPDTAVYVVMAGTAAPRETGAYTLTISASATAAAAQLLPLTPRRALTQRELRLPSGSVIGRTSRGNKPARGGGR